MAQGVVFGLEELLFPVVATAAGLFGRGAVMGQLVGVDAVEQFGAAPDVEEALAQEGAQGPFGGGIDVGGRDEVGAEQVGELFGVNAVILVLAAVDEVEVERMSQDEGQALGLAGVGQPIPAEHTFGADSEVVAVGFDELEEVGEVVVLDVAVDQFPALAVHDADVHLMGMEVDSAVVFGGGGVILHTLIQ